MIRKFLYWLTSKLPARAINGDRGEPYLERYYLFSLFGVRAYIHRFIASDPDRGLHDHPWGWSVSWLLAGRYREIRAYRFDRRGRAHGGERQLGAGRINVIRGTDFHRLLVEPGKEVWTLFVHGPRVKGWGFIRDAGYIQFAKGADDYPSRQWWHTAPRGRALRLEGDLNEVARICGAWANATFAPDGGYRGQSIVAHLAKEVVELAENPRDMVEVADCMLLLMHLAHQNGGDLRSAMARKLEINRHRKWGKPDANGVVEHVRESQ